MNYETWEESVPETIKRDVLWTVQAYRLSLFLGDLGWHDITKLSGDHRTRGLADQLCRATGSIGANLAEGYSRSTGHDRARFYEYALGSARETREWYYRGRHILGTEVTDHRLDVLTQIIRLLLRMIPSQRSGQGRLHDQIEEYTSEQKPDETPGTP